MIEAVGWRVDEPCEGCCTTTELSLLSKNYMWLAIHRLKFILVGVNTPHSSK
jgi:hypothetical protein